ncbi:aldehyde dehydrogenase [Microvirga zambiensis]|uniref:aldehyde dehydrogenase n=1 Tax=Microvirga zambiensis TaxID=1402137 RepID=UPI001FEC48F2|nr:aldehyde dehydrogenase [Microvirga zambiensis]
MPSNQQLYLMYAGGQWFEAASGQTFDSVDPYRGHIWARLQRAGTEDVDRAVSSASAAFRSGDWANLTASMRGRLLTRLGDEILRNADELATIESRDNGKPLSEMRAHIRELAKWYYYYGGLADKLEGAVVPVDKPDMFTFTRKEPLGVCVAITPWNSPLMLATWKLAPGLAAGNTFVLKPSEFTSASSLELCRVFEAAGFPPGVLNVVTGFGTEIGESLVSHPDVAKVTFTGGDAAGDRVAALAAKHRKRLTLELGGKSPNIVFADANLDNAARGVAAGIFAAAGQTCIAGSRLLVQEEIAEELLERVGEIARSARMGDPLDGDTQVGPITTPAQFNKILEYIDIGHQEGAKCILGGAAKAIPDAPTARFIEPTIFDAVLPDMRIAQEEIFGPVLAAIRFQGEEEAVGIANNIRYGLAAGVWTGDIGRAFRMAERLQAGTVWVNTYRAAGFQMPFGGYKKSGYGRENGLEAINDFLQTKSVWIGLGDTSDPFRMR